jgi:hypothetical protein
MMGGLVFLSPGAPSPHLPPSFYVEGPTDQILGALIDAHGIGHVTVHPGAEAGHSLALLYGDIHIDLDAALFAHPGVSAGLVVGDRPFVTRAGLFVDGRLVSRGELLPGGRFPVPIHLLHEHGLLKDGADLFAAQDGGQREHVQLSAFGGVVSLHQMN